MCWTGRITVNSRAFVIQHPVYKPGCSCRIWACVRPRPCVMIKIPRQCDTAGCCFVKLSVVLIAPSYFLIHSGLSWMSVWVSWQSAKGTHGPMCGRPQEPPARGPGHRAGSATPQPSKGEYSYDPFTCCVRVEMSKSFLCCGTLKQLGLCSNRGTVWSWIIK